MRCLRLYLRSRRVLAALAVAATLVAVVWGLWLAYSGSRNTDARLVGLTVMLAVTALSPTLSGADDALDRTGSVNWSARRAGHLLLTAATVTALLSLTAIVDARFAPLDLVLRDTVGLLGLTALGAALLGAAYSWIAPLTWTLVMVLPWMEPGRALTTQLGVWLIQPTGSTAATACAVTLGAAGLLAYTVYGCPRRPAVGTVTEH